MFWIADVLIGTRSQVWGKGYVRADTSESSHRVAKRGRPFAATGRALKRIIRPIRAAHERHVAVRNMSRLSDHMLRDIGVTRAEIGNYVRNQESRYLKEPQPSLLRRPVETARSPARSVTKVPSTVANELREADGANAREAGDTVRRAA